MDYALFSFKESLKQREGKIREKQIRIVRHGRCWHTEKTGAPLERVVRRTLPKNTEDGRSEQTMLVAPGESGHELNVLRWTIRFYHRPTMLFLALDNDQLHHRTLWCLLKSSVITEIESWRGVRLEECLFEYFFLNSSKDFPTDTMVLWQ